MSVVSYWGARSSGSSSSSSTACSCPTRSRMQQLCTSRIAGSSLLPPRHTHSPAWCAHRCQRLHAMQPDRDDKEPTRRDTIKAPPTWAAQLQQRWLGLDSVQKAYTVGVGLLLLLAVPKALTLLVLGAERVLIGGLLATEELLLELLLRGGALLAALGLVGVGIYVFAVRRTTQ